MRRALTPRSLKRERVHRRAREQFAARGLHLPGEQTGVLIFASLSERMVEVVADHRIVAVAHPEAWSDVVAALTAGMKAGDPGAGFAAAIQRAGVHLAEHFPPPPRRRKQPARHRHRARVAASRRSGPSLPAGFRASRT